MKLALSSQQPAATRPAQRRPFSPALASRLLICPAYLDLLREKGHEAEYTVLEAVGMGFLACDMPGLDQNTRTVYMELLNTLLVYNIAGDQLFMPFLGGEKRKEKSKYRGVREGKMQGFPSTNLLAFVANADARAKLRQDEELYEQLCELSFNQRDVENCAPPPLEPDASDPRSRAETAGPRGAQISRSSRSSSATSPRSACSNCARCRSTGRRRRATPRRANPRRAAPARAAPTRAALSPRARAADHVRGRPGLHRPSEEGHQVQAGGEGAGARQAGQRRLVEQPDRVRRLRGFTTGAVESRARPGNSAPGRRERPRTKSAPSAGESASGQRVRPRAKRERARAHRRRAPPHARCRASQSRLAQSVEQILRRVARRLLQGHGVARAARRARARQGQRAPHPSQGPGRRGRPDAVGLGQVTARRRRDDRRPRGGRRL